jgi:beta-mannanase
MWEFNGRFYPWSVRTGNPPSTNNGSNYSVNARNYVNGWRHMVTAYRSIIPGLRFVWCPLRGQDTPRNVEMCWPGSTFVSMVGLDAYNHGPAKLTPDQRWNALVSGGGGNWPGLDWHAKFAQAQTRPLSFPEWGVVQRNDGTGGADDPNYVRKFLSWVDCHNVHSHCYFEKDAADARHQLHDYPGQPAVVKFPRSRLVFDALMMEA